MNNMLMCEQLSLTQGPIVSLSQVLDARETRAARQRGLLEKYARPIISLTLVIPGEIKDSPGARFLLDTALDTVIQHCHDAKWSVLSCEVIQSASGAEALLVVDASASALKQMMLEQEETHPLGRLWDGDVICPQSGAISRRMLNIAPRRCLLCDEAAHACARSRRHALSALIAVMEEKIHAYRLACSCS